MIIINNWLKKLFSKHKYTKKERFILIMAIIPMGAGQGIAGYYITYYLGIELSDKATKDTIVPLLICMGLYMYVAYVASYYVIKILTEGFLFMYGIVKFKLTGKHYVPDNRRY